MALCCVLPAPAIGQVLGHCHRGERFSVEEFIPDSAVDGFSKAVFHREPGSMYAVLVLLYLYQRRRAWVINTGSFLSG